MNASRTRNQGAGAALLAVLGYVTAVGLLASSFVLLVHRGMSAMREDQRTVVVMGLAEAGIDKAIAELRSQGPAYEGETATPLGAGEFSVSVTKLKQAGAYEVVSEARLPGIAARGANARITARIVFDGARRVKELRWTETKTW